MPTNTSVAPKVPVTPQQIKGTLLIISPYINQLIDVNKLIENANIDKSFADLVLKILYA